MTSAHTDNLIKNRNSLDHYPKFGDNVASAQDAKFRRAAVRFVTMTKAGTAKDVSIE